MFSGLKWVQIMQMCAEKFLCSSKVTKRQLSEPYDISTKQTETDDNVKSCGQYSQFGAILSCNTYNSSKMSIHHLYLKILFV